MAIRTLQQLATDSQKEFPQAAYILQNETYVDDILSGSHDIASVLDSLHQVIKVLQSAGFPLRKITSNCAEILQSVPRETLLDTEFLKFQETSATKTLGIQWNALSDSFSYSVEPILTGNSVTKRKILSTVSKLFDPAGWFSPIVIRAKILLQQLWMEGISWDEEIKKQAQIFHLFAEDKDILAPYSKWNHALRIFTYVFRFCKRLKEKKFKCNQQMVVAKEKGIKQLKL